VVLRSSQNSFGPEAQLGYDQTVGVDPQNSHRIYMRFQELWISDDGRTTWWSGRQVGLSRATPSVACRGAHVARVDNDPLAFAIA
jgi:hypothetical protein